MTKFLLLRNRSWKQQECTYMWGEEVLITRGALQKCEHSQRKLAFPLRYIWPKIFRTYPLYLWLTNENNLSSYRFMGPKQQWLAYANRLLSALALLHELSTPFFNASHSRHCHCKFLVSIIITLYQFCCIRYLSM